MRALVGQLGSNGDCLYATIIARQFKADHPGCHVTWAIARQCSHVLRNNPYVDEIWEWPVPDWSLPQQAAAWQALETAVLRRQDSRDPFDSICLSQIWPRNFRRYDGTIRASILRAYGRPITVPIDSVIVLDAEEVDNVARFAHDSGIDRFQHRILFECAANSAQSYVTPHFAIEVAERVGRSGADSIFILSTQKRLDRSPANVIWADRLTMRENAALTHYGTIFVGCGSGLTVVATSEAAKPLPNIQILSRQTSVYASFHHDFLYWGKPADRFIEMSDVTADEVAGAIIGLINDGAEAVRAKYHHPLPVTFDHYLQLVDQFIVKSGRPGRYCDALESLTTTAERYGWSELLLDYARREILPHVWEDPLSIDPRSRERIGRMMALPDRAV